MSLIIMAFRNLARNKKRTLITCSALAFGLLSYILFDSILNGADAESVRNYRRYGSGDSAIMHRDFWEEREKLRLEHVVENADQIVAELGAAGIDAVPRTRVPVELIVYRDPYPEDGSLRGQLYVVDPGDTGEVFDYANVIAEGRYLSEDSPAGGGGIELVLGGWIAEDLGAAVGYPITLSTRTRDGFRQSFDAEIVGILNSPDPVINRSVALMAQHHADALLQLDGAATEVVLPQITSEAGEIADRIVAGYAGSGIERVPFERLIEDYLMFVQSESSSSQIVLFVVFIIAAVGISNTMLMATLQRRREIGMLRAIGMHRRSIMRMMLTEAAALGAVGGVLGMILGAAANIPLVARGIDYSKWIRDYDLGYRVSGVFYGSWQLDTIIGAFIIAVILSLVTAYIPVRRILRRHSITDCLRA